MPRHTPDIPPGIGERRIEALRCRNHRLVLGARPLVVGILNVTPDSFSDGGRYATVATAVEHARRMAVDGADVVDIGGESTRPGAEPIPTAEECDRVLPVIRALREAWGDGGVPLSIDTRKAEVADEALQAGCAMVNDVGAGTDPDMADVMVRHGDEVPVVLMHMKGNPRTMQVDPSYDDVVGEVCAFLSGCATALERAGVAPHRIVVDPGIGFGKRFADNLELLNRIDVVRSLGYPVLVGASRKRFIGELLDAPPDERINGNLAVAAVCHRSRVEMIRVHDVRDTVQLLTVLDAVAGAGSGTRPRRAAPKRA